MLENEIPSKYTIKNTMQGDDHKFNGHISFSPEGVGEISGNLLIDFEKLSAQMKLEQDIMPGEFQDMAVKLAWNDAKKSVNFQFKRDGKKGKANGKLIILNNGLELHFQLKDSLLESFLPSGILSKITADTNGSTGLDFGITHQHKSKSFGNAKAIVTLVVNDIKFDFHSKVQTNDIKTEQRLLLQGSSFNSMSSPAKLQLTSSMNHDNFAFVIELATDSSKNAEFKQMIKMNEKTIQISTKYESSDYNYEFPSMWLLRTLVPLCHGLIRLI
jgi:hypothetical protein